MKTYMEFKTQLLENIENSDLDESILSALNPKKMFKKKPKPEIKPEKPPERDWDFWDRVGKSYGGSSLTPSSGSGSSSSGSNYYNDSFWNQYRT